MPAKTVLKNAPAFFWLLLLGIAPSKSHGEKFSLRVATVFFYGVACFFTIVQCWVLCFYATLSRVVLYYFFKSIEKA